MHLFFLLPFSDKNISAFYLFRYPPFTHFSTFLYLCLSFFLLPFCLSIILSFFHGSILLHFSSLIPFLCFIFISLVCVCVLGQVGPSARTSVNRAVSKSVNQSVSQLDSHRVSQSVSQSVSQLDNQKRSSQKLSQSYSSISVRKSVSTERVSHPVSHLVSCSIIYIVTNSFMNISTILPVWMSTSFPIPAKCHLTESPRHISNPGRFP